MKLRKQPDSIIDFVLVKIVLFVYGLQNFFLSVIAKVLFKHPRNPKHILLVRKGTIGDWICTWPSLHQIKKMYPDASFTLLTSYGKREEVGFLSMFGLSMFDEVISVEKYTSREIHHKIKSSAFDLVIELPQDLDTFYTQLRNMLFFRICGVYSGYGWKVTNIRWFKMVQYKYFTFLNEQERLAYALHPLSLEWKQHDAGYVVPADTNNLLPITFNQPKEKRIAVAVGAKLERKKWPIEYFKTVVDELLKQGFEVVLIGNDDDANTTQNWLPDVTHNLCGKIKVQTTLSLLKEVALTISNDSGPMHLSYAAGTPVIAVFSARNFHGKWFPPPVVQQKVFYPEGVSCAICIDKTCADNHCMRNTKPGDVLAAVEQIVQLPR